MTDTIEMTFEEKKLLEIGNYAKGWYGSFTGAGDIAYTELAIIFGHLCGIDPQYVARKDLFLQVDAAFRHLAKVRDPEDNWMHRELICDALFPNWPNLEPQDPFDVRMLNKMLRIIAQVEVQHFPNGNMVMDANIARLLPFSEHNINRRKELGFELIND